MSDYTLPPAYAFGLTQSRSLEDYGHACAEAARAPLVARIAEMEQSVETFRAARDGYRDDAFRLSADKRALLQGGQEQASEIARLRAELSAKDARIAELENQLGITRMCVMCGKYKPAAEPRESPGCPPVDPEYGHLCGFDMTPQEAWAHWRQRAHDRRIESDRLRAELAAKAGEVEALRRLLFQLYTVPGMGYTDDGELQESTVHSSIDFLRMTPDQIQEAIRRREGKGGRLGELAAEVEKYRADAERWRHFLSRRFVMAGNLVVMDAHRTALPDELISAIDREIAARKGEGA